MIVKNKIFIVTLIIVWKNLCIGFKLEGVKSFKNVDSTHGIEGDFFVYTL